MNKQYVLLTGTALGAGLTYLLDPISGKRRRAYTRDKMRHFAKEADAVTGRTLRDLRNRYEGLVAETQTRWFEEQVADDVLAGRVRTILGRVISHPGSVDVTADRGRITLSGAILASDERKLLHRVRAVQGVRDVQNDLEVYKSAAHVPGLQGGVPRQERSELMQISWSPTARFFSILGGGAAALYGFWRHDGAGMAAALLGMGFAARGITNTELRRLLRITPREPAELTPQKRVIETEVAAVEKPWAEKAAS
jgi:osmotically-inducible protein OsmY